MRVIILGSGGFISSEVEKILKELLDLLKDI
jgi:hypothetical protein